MAACGLCSGCWVEETPVDSLGDTQGHSSYSPAPWGPGDVSGPLALAFISSPCSATTKASGCVDVHTHTHTHPQTQIQQRFITAPVHGALSSVLQIYFRLNY